MRFHRNSAPVISQGLAIAFVLAITASAAHAHGGMAGPDELGPPLFTSAALAFICYWVVILWPASKRKGSGDAPEGSEAPSSKQRHTSKKARKKTAPRQASQLRKVA